MEWLHLCNDAKFTEAFEVCRCEHLRMDQTKTPIAFTVFLVQLLEIVEQDAIRFVADRVHSKLQARPVRIEHVTQELPFNKCALLVHHQWSPAPAVLGII